LAQEAHEAIRPTSVLRTPEALHEYLTPQQARLYELIWQRFLASQMKPARYATMTVDILAARDYLFRATGQTLIFPGYTILYTEGRDDEQEDEGNRPLPPLSEGEVLDLIKLIPAQHFTEPPPRYTEPTLIKALEANGVGRPSTYASIVTVVQERGYVIKDKGRLFPTALGMVVCDALMATFADIMNVGYTADMEKGLDQVAAGKLGYVSMLNGFYEGFSPELARAKEQMPHAIEQALWADLSEEVRQRTCPQCGKPLQVRVSETGRFLGCTGYPECRYILDLSTSGKPTEPVAEFAEGEMCELCGGRMKIITHGKAKFLGCENYPQCKNTRAILSERIKQLAAETACPRCALKPLTPKKGRFGEYLHCPQCAVNYSLRQLGLATGKGDARAQAAPPEMVDVECPECGHKPLQKRKGRFGPYYRCTACKKNFSARKMADKLPVASVPPDQDV
jgi:DNA topoisomerase I